MLTCHPRALFLLLVVEALERFAFTAALALLVLYLTEQRGFAEDMALLTCHLGLSISYLASLPCGWLVNRWLGHRLGTLLGATLLLFGYAALAMGPALSFWPALALLMIAGALFRTSITVLCGRLYESADPRRHDGFMALYVAVNLGYLAGPLYVDWAKSRWGWSRVFLTASFAMFVAVLFLAIGLWGVRREIEQHPQHSYQSLPAHVERQRFHVLLFLCAIAVIFFLALQQANGTLLLFIASYVRPQLDLFGYPFRTGPEFFTSLHGGAVLVLALLGILGKKWLQQRGRELSLPIALVWGFAFMVIAFALLSAAIFHSSPESRVSPWWMVGVYFLLSVGEVLLAPLSLSLMTQLTPPSRASLGGALWYVAGAGGIAGAGALGLLWGRWPIPFYFAFIAALSLAATVALLARTRSLKTVLRSSG